VRAIRERSVYRRAFSTAVPARRPSSSASSRSARENVRPDSAARGGHRHDHHRSHAQSAQRLELLGIGDRLREQLVGDLVDDLRGAAADDLGRSAGIAHAGRIALVVLTREAHARGVDVRDGHRAQVALRVRHAHAAPVGELRDGEAGDARERLLVVQRRREQIAGLG
jgi:hypothetical protein